MSDRLGIIVPFRDRQQHLDTFVPHMQTFFRDDLLNQDISVRILIVEQSPGLPFNRGAIKNIGYRYLAADVDYVCFHDVDLLPISADYRSSPDPVMIAFHGIGFTPEFVKGLFGGVVLLQKDQYEQANGFSNDYWGWGFEDVDLAMRLRRCYIFHHTGRGASNGFVTRIPPGATTVSLARSTSEIASFIPTDGTGSRKAKAKLHWRDDGLNTVAFEETRPRRELPLTGERRVLVEQVLVSLPRVD